MFLDEKTFETVIASAPLISIDLVVKNTKGEYLLGFRTNRPAKNYWFVPGGRIQKDESINDAFLRLTKEELGLAIKRSDTLFLGPFEHFYQDYVFGNEHTTHYVVLAYTLMLDIALSDLPDAQHSKYQWFSAEDMQNRDDVHVHSTWYIHNLALASSNAIPLL
jgi:colanic acid biosynthesis protein WcaH